MPVAFREFGVPDPPRSTPRCSRCGRTSTVPLAERPPCACGSNAWTTGPSMAWPPFLLGSEVSPHFLFGPMPRTAGVSLDVAERRPAHRVTHGAFLAEGGE